MTTTTTMIFGRIGSYLFRMKETLLRLVGGESRGNGFPGVGQNRRKEKRKKKEKSGEDEITRQKDVPGRR